MSCPIGFYPDYASASQASLTSDNALFFFYGVSGAVFAISRFGQTTVVKAVLGSECAALFVLGELGEGAVKPWSLAKVTHEGDKFVHESCGTFFALEGAEKQFTLIQGLPWEGGDSIDDYC